VQQVRQNIAVLIKQYGGMVMHHQVRSTVDATKDIQISNDSLNRISAYNTIADMTVKIPSEKLEDFINRLGHMGIYVTEQKMDIEDRSLEYFLPG